MTEQIQESRPTAQPTALWRRALAEAVGTAALVAVVVGSGIAAVQLSPNDVGLQLLENSLATAFGLAVLIVMFQNLSGAHFNPVVTIVDRLLGSDAKGRDLGVYSVAQILGGIGGAVLANLMFEVPTAISTKERIGAGTFLSEIVATVGLILVIFALVRSGRSGMVGPAVGAYIGAAYWFTASTSFANPAVTIGRIFTDTFAGIAPVDALWFLLAQIIGGALSIVFVRVLFPKAPLAV